jgi:hypothetical protein
MIISQEYVKNISQERATKDTLKAENTYFLLATWLLDLVPRKETVMWL